jgi:hypothetical protein
MSLPSIGDDGDPPENWADTSMRQEFDALRARFAKWQLDYQSEIPNDDFQTVINKLNDNLDELSLLMEGPL